MPPVVFASGDREHRLSGLDLPLQLGHWVPAARSWEVELGFGKGKYLLRRAAAQPGTGFLGIELVSAYFRRLLCASRRLRLGNLALLRGEALFLLAVVLPRHFAAAVHVYFPDPWPKHRHHRRRLFDPATADLVIGLLRPGGSLFFATDHLEYGEWVAQVLAGAPALRVRRRDGPWPEGPRTHYEAKYLSEGRSILRLEAELQPAAALAALHPQGKLGVVAAAGKLARQREPTDR